MSNLATITNNILADSGIDDINVIVSTGSYADPSWITSLAWTKITGSPLGAYLPLSGGVMTGPITTPNGTFGIIVGDDSRLADRNIANTLFVEGVQNTDRGYINFSQTTGNALGAINGGDLTWRGNAVVTGAGTTNTLTKFTGASTIGNSIVSESGAMLSVAGDLTVGVGVTTGNTDIRIVNDTNGKIHYVFSDTGTGELGFESGVNVGIRFNTNGPNTKLIITSGGNVLIGNPPAADNGARLQVSGTGTFTSDITANRYRGVNSLILNNYTTVNPSSNVYLYSPPTDRDAWIYLDSATTASNWGIYHRQIDSSVGGLPANSIGFIGGDTNTLQAWISLANGNGYYAGNLLVGTTTDFGQKFQVSAGNTSESTAHINLSNAGIYSGFHFLNDTGYYIGQNSAFRSLKLYSGTNINIGMTLAPSGAATFSSSVTANGTATFLAQFGNGNNVNEKVIQFLRASASTDIVNIQGINAGVGASAIALQALGGNVGIGTPSPATKLHIASTIENIVTNEVLSGGQYALYRLKNSNYTVDLGLDNTGLYLDGAGGATRFFNGGGSPRMTITSGGNVLIGTTTDTGNDRRLQVAGNLFVNDNETTGNGVQLRNADRPLITRGWDAFTSGNKTGVGRWGVYMESAELFLGSPGTDYSGGLVTIGGWLVNGTRQPNLTVNNQTRNVSITSLTGSGNRIVVANSGGTLISAVIGSGLAFDGTTLTATGGGSGSISGSGTSGTVALFTGATSIGNSAITQSGSDITFSSGINPTKTAKNTYAIQIRGAFYGAPRLQVYDLNADPNGYMGLGTDMSGAPYEFSNYFPRTAGNGRWSVGSWAGNFGTGQYVSGYNEKLFITENAAQFNVPLTVTSSVAIGTGFTPSNIFHAYSSLPRVISDTSSNFAVFNLYQAGSEKGAFYLDNSAKQIITEANGDNTYSLLFRTAGNPRMTILSGGNVGIGTITPATRFHVESASVSYGQLRFLNTSSSGETSINIGRTNQTLEQRWTIGQGVAGIGDSFGFYTGGSSRVNLQTNGNFLIGSTSDNGARLQVSGRSTVTDSVGGNTIMEVSNTNTTNGFGLFVRGGVGSTSYAINVVNAANTVDLFKIMGSGAATFSSSVTATSFFESSDATLKTLLADNYQAKGIDSVVAKLYIKNGKEEIGYFAQDLKDVLPSAVSKGSDGLLNLSYREVHTAKIAYLEEEIRQLKKKYENN